MKKTALFRLAICFVIFSIILVSCAPDAQESTNHLTADKLVKLVDNYDTYAFDGRLTLEADLPSFALDTMRTLPLEQNIEMTWNGKYQKNPFRMEAEIELTTVLQGTEMAIPITIIANENNLFLASPALTQDRYIHQGLEQYGGGTLPDIFTELFKKAIVRLNEHSDAESTSASLAFHLEKDTIDAFIQQLLFYDLPNKLTTTGEESFPLAVNDIGNHRVNYIDNKDSFFELLTVKEAELKWQINESVGTLEQSWNVAMRVDDESKQGSISIKGSQLFSEPNSQIVFEQAIPSSDRLLPLNDMLTLIKMFGK